MYDELKAPLKTPKTHLEGKMLKIIHTSDWHLGHTLFDKKRGPEFEAFIHWFIQIVNEEKPNIVLISGDIFNSSLPSSLVQTLYYHFLTCMSLTDCRHIVITAGNHDSPSLLDAPRDILKHLRIHVIGQMRTPDEECMLLDDVDGNPLAIVCAVPFLRDKDVYRADEESNPQDHDRIVAEGIREHYRLCARKAVELRAGRNIPVIAMGHLFVSGAVMNVEGSDDIRYVGSLAAISSDIFPPDFDYVALGHLHIPQKVGSDRIRYSGSPLPTNFSEGNTKKQILVLEGEALSARSIEVPVFQQLESIKGDMDFIRSRLSALKQSKESVWAEVVYTGNDPEAQLREKVTEETKNTNVAILRILDKSNTSFQSMMDENVPLPNNLTPEEMFERRLDECPEMSDEMKSSLRMTYAEALERLMAQETTEQN